MREHIKTLDLKNRTRRTTDRFTTAAVAAKDFFVTTSRVITMGFVYYVYTIATYFGGAMGKMDAFYEQMSNGDYLYAAFSLLGGIWSAVIASDLLRALTQSTAKLGAEAAKTHATKKAGAVAIAKASAPLLVICAAGYIFYYVLLKDGLDELAEVMEEHADLHEEQGNDAADINIE